MAKQLKLAFSKIILKSHGEKINLIDYSNKVLEKTKPEKLTRKSNTIVSFLDIKIKEINDQRILIGFYGYALGDKYKVIDPDKKTTSKQDYPIPPFQSEALFLILESGHIIFEEKSVSYIKPERIKDALETAFRAYNFEIPVKIDFLELSENIETMIEFIYSLNALVSIEFSNLRHSNPSEVSEYFDEATNAKIDNIVESSNAPNGIDRENEEFKNQINHVRKYGILRKSMGIDNDGFRIMELIENKIRLTVTLKDLEVDTKIYKMFEVFRQILDKLN